MEISRDASILNGGESVVKIDKDHFSGCHERRKILPKLLHAETCRENSPLGLTIHGRSIRLDGARLSP